MLREADVGDPRLRRFTEAEDAVRRIASQDPSDNAAFW